MLNDVTPFIEINPTAENLSRFIYKKLYFKIPNVAKLKWVQVYESPDSYSEYSEQ